MIEGTAVLTRSAAEPAGSPSQNGDGHGVQGSIASTIEENHVPVMEPEPEEEFETTVGDGEDVPNDFSVDMPSVEDTGRIEERLDHRRMSMPKAADLKALFHHLKETSEGEEEGVQPSQQLQQLQQQLHKYFHSHFSSGNADNSEERHKFQSMLLRGFKRSNRNQPSGDRRRSTIGYKDSQRELEIKEQEKTEFIIRSLVFGYPEVLFTSSYFLNDEHGQRKVPMLLSMISLSVREVTKNTHSKRRAFKLYLEYGLGGKALRWTIERDYKQLMGFHNRLRIQLLQDNVLFKGTGKKTMDLPKFPKARIASRRNSVSGRFSPPPVSTDVPTSRRRSYDGAPPVQHEGSHRRHSSEAVSSANESYNSATTTLSSSLSTHSADSTGSMASAISAISNAWKRAFLKLNRGSGARTNYSLQDSLQEYFDALFKSLLLRPESTKLLQFLELSPMSVLLSLEKDYKRKEGYLFIKTTAKAQGWRVGHLKYRDFKAMVVRHTAKWFIVGHSYIMYVSDINSTTPLDVFLVDSNFKVSLSGFGDLSNKGITFVDFMKQQLQGDSDSSDDDDEDGPIEDFGKNKANPYFSMTLENSERKLSVMSKSARQLKSWCRSIYEMTTETPWGQKHRFESFAPVRDNCFAQWFVDARDYMWAASSAMEMAKDVIFIHDWWLTPELYLRRPADGNQEWRIDRILKRKAEQGVKIFVIVYRNIISAVITDSLWTKHSLLDLHPNIHVLRSPNQWMQNVYFWAHHEKLLIVDQMVSFVGGIDFCFGRYDTPDHTLVDDSPYAFRSQVPEDVASKKQPISFQKFPGKDYSNPRVGDFYDLQDAFHDMYDRQTTPRMPWHDVHMVTCGQAARDLSRHFVQRWNYMLRQKRPSRPTPLLLPPRDFTQEELDRFQFNGSCEVQLLRSACFWSLGLQAHEQSIENAYIKCIETSEHFVYMENQFFVTSCEVDGVMVQNRIGDALVDRIIRAHKNKETWRAVIVIPLLPGFESEVDRQDGSSVRLIMQCQYMSISMGESSIFAKLRKVGVVPEDYIQFYSLRRWGTIGRKKLLVTEQLYIHAKVMVVDDRTAIIGSANINERSMRGTRDSEVCAIVRDKDMVETLMDGQKYEAGKFAHTLRMRLMREHLGVDVDLFDMVERRFSEIESFAKTDIGCGASTLSAGDEGDPRLSAMVELGTRYLLGEDEGTPRFRSRLTRSPSTGKELTEKMLASLNKLQSKDENDGLDDIGYVYSFNHRAGKENVGIRDRKPFSTDTRVATPIHRGDVLGYGADKYQSSFYVTSKERLNTFLQKITDLATEDDPLPNYEDVIEYLNSGDESLSIDQLNEEHWTMLKRLFYMQKLESKRKCQQQSSEKERSSPSSTEPEEGRAPSSIPIPSIPMTTLSDAEISEIDKTVLPQTVTDFVDPYAFEDPLDIDFLEGTWMPQAIRNTMLFQMVFHVQPDDTVLSWKEYKQFQELKHAFMDHQKIVRGFYDRDSDEQYPAYEGEGEEEGEEDQEGSTEEDGARSATATSQVHFDMAESDESKETLEATRRRILRRARMAELDRFQRAGSISGPMTPMVAGGNFVSGYGPMVVYDYETAKKLLGLIKGRVVKFPTRWLKKEVEGSNWFYKADKLPPIQIWN
ncbi:DEKNAAC102326 [Brettanomyces naardenensis]|uniref:Phospholipase n=1 Tax=Brettanomyces naardenensis TaxID=13370 RepID=A0A448YKL2_BRENA|nr:DEKNAAC102326 [Brettanomyces naardenensis]